MDRSNGDAAWVAGVLSSGTTVRVGEPALTDLIRSLERRQLAAGHVLYTPNRIPAGIWMIRSGSVEVSQGCGRFRSVVTILRPGDVVADVYLLLNARPPFTARCSEATEAWFLPVDTFRTLLSRHPTLAIAWLCNLAQRLSQTRARVLEILGRSLPQRVARLLLEESSDDELRLPQKTVAEMLGVQRTSVNKTLKQLEKAGIVQLGYGTVKITDALRLEEIAGGTAASAPITTDAIRREIA